MGRSVELFKEYCYPRGLSNWGIAPDGWNEPVIEGVDFCEYARNYVDSFQEIPQPEHLNSCNICLINQRMVEAVMQEWQPLPDSRAAELVELVGHTARTFIRRDPMEEGSEYKGFSASLVNNPELLSVFRILVDAESAPKVEPPPGFADRMKGFVAGYMRGLEDRR